MARQTATNTRIVTPLKWLRENWLWEQHGINTTQRTLCLELDVATTTFSNWERGLYKPNRDSWRQYARLLRVNTANFATAVNLSRALGKANQNLVKAKESNVGVTQAQSALQAIEQECQAFFTHMDDVKPLGSSSKPAEDREAVPA